GGAGAATCAPGQDGRARRRARSKRCTSWRSRWSPPASTARVGCGSAALVSCPKQIGPRSVWEKQATIKTLVGRFTQRLVPKRCDRTTSVLPQTDRSPICLGKAGHYQDSGGPIHATLGSQALRSDHECPAPNRSVPDLFGKSRPLSR